MVREGSGYSPVAIIVHLLGIAAGLYLGFLVMDGFAPDLPSGDVVPGVGSSAAPDDVAGDDPDSLFAAANLMPALDQLSEQVPAGHEVVRLRIEPGATELKTANADGLFSLDDVDPAVAQRLIDEIHAQRANVTAHDIGYIELVATSQGPEWYVQLDIDRTDVDPPWTYSAPLEGAAVEPGGAPPQPVVED
jgi:hypothetical protein